MMENTSASMVMVAVLQYKSSEVCTAVDMSGMIVGKPGLIRRTNSVPVIDR